MYRIFSEPHAFSRISAARQAQPFVIHNLASYVGRLAFTVPRGQLYRPLHSTHVRKSTPLGSSLHVYIMNVVLMVLLPTMDYINPCCWMDASPTPPYNTQRPGGGSAARGSGNRIPGTVTFGAMNVCERTLRTPHGGSERRTTAVTMAVGSEEIES